MRCTSEYKEVLDLMKIIGKLSMVFVIIAVDFQYHHGIIAGFMQALFKVLKA